MSFLLVSNSIMNTEMHLRLELEQSPHFRLSGPVQIFQCQGLTKTVGFLSSRKQCHILSHVIYAVHEPFMSVVTKSSTAAFILNYHQHLTTCL